MWSKTCKQILVQFKEYWTYNIFMISISKFFRYANEFGPLEEHMWMFILSTSAQFLIDVAGASHN
jgi:hypothetical protein